MEKLIVNGLLLVILIAFSYYAIQWIFQIREGAENMSPATEVTGAGAQARTAELKTYNSDKRDKILVSKHRATYEDTVVELAKLVETLAVTTVLNIDYRNPMPGLEKIVMLRDARLALGDTLKYITNMD